MSNIEVEIVRPQNSNTATQKTEIKHSLRYGFDQTSRNKTKKSMVLSDLGKWL